MNNTLESSLNRRHALALLGSGLALGAGTAGAAEANTAAWDATLKQARGQTVYFNAWAGSDNINAYIRWAAQEAEQKRREQLHPDIRARMHAAAPSTDDLRLITWVLIQGLDWQVEERALKRHGISTATGYKRDDMTWLDDLSADQLRTLALDLVLDQAIEVEYSADSNRPLFDRVTSVYGFDQAAASTPSTAGASAEEDEPAAPATPAKGRPAVKYFDAATGQSWNGRGLRPAWIKAALASGKSLDDFAAAAEGNQVKVDAGVAGDRGAADLFAAEEATA